MSAMVDIGEVSPLDEAGFARWHAALASRGRDGEGAAAVSSLQELTASLAVPSPVKRRIAVGAFLDGGCVGGMLFEMPLQSDLETVLTLYLPRTRPEHAHQDDTLVLRAHRGHRLGSRLKVANLRQLERLPVSDIAARRWLHTYTAQGNAPMQAVNARFGFRRVEVAHEFERAGSGGAGRS